MKPPQLIATPPLTHRSVEIENLLEECRIINVPRFTDQRGTLSPIQGPPLVPFDPKRFYYIYDVPVGVRRGCHAHKTEKELMIALAGSFNVLVDNGESTKEFRLDRPDLGLYIPPLVWHELHSFSVGCVCAVLASKDYNRADYIQNHEDFLKTARKKILR